MNPKKEILRGLWVRPKPVDPSTLDKRGEQPKSPGGGFAARRAAGPCCETAAV